jgi:predicted metal-dependent HD superfamily phosphohydrolase
MKVKMTEARRMLDNDFAILGLFRGMYDVYERAVRSIVC